MANETAHHLDTQSLRAQPNAAVPVTDNVASIWSSRPLQKFQENQATADAAHAQTPRRISANLTFRIIGGNLLSSLSRAANAIRTGSNMDIEVTAKTMLPASCSFSVTPLLVCMLRSALSNDLTLAKS
mmetsp:Transcript_9985/g.28175  ORF Transcript_9985/g.28175 Transcript_9985/m.28175 type:complete len:128 (+) Transcript_9985:492-875(+)